MLSADKLRQYGITLDEYYEQKYSMDNSATQYDIALAIFNNKISEYSTYDQNLRLLRNVYLSMAKFYFSQNMKYESIKCYCLILYTDFCVSVYEDAFIASGIIKQIYDLKEFYSKDIFVFCTKFNIPKEYNRISSAKFSQLLDDIFNGTEIEDLKEKYL